MLYRGELPVWQPFEEMPYGDEDSESGRRDSDGGPHS